jgi:predicted nucleic acid-binding Zn ribbon protein
MGTIYQYSGKVFIFTVYPDRITIKRKKGLDDTSWCVVCGRPLEQPSTGRRRKYCSDKCRKRDSRKRSKRWNTVTEVQDKATKLNSVYEGAI